MGFSECINEVSLFLNDLDPNKADLRASLMEHLANCAAGYLPDGTDTIYNQHSLLTKAGTQPAISTDQNDNLNPSPNIQIIESVPNLNLSGTYDNPARKRLLINTEDEADLNGNRNKHIPDYSVICRVENAMETLKNRASVQETENIQHECSMVNTSNNPTEQSFCEKSSRPDSINISNALSTKSVQYTGNLAAEKQKAAFTTENPNISTNNFDFESHHISVSETVGDDTETKGGVTDRTELQPSNDLRQITALSYSVATSPQSVLSTPLYAVHLAQLQTGPIALIVPANIVTPHTQEDLTGTISQSPSVSTISSATSSMPTASVGSFVMTPSPSEGKESFTHKGQQKDIFNDKSSNKNTKVQISNLSAKPSKLNADGALQISPDSLSLQSRCSNQPRTKSVNILHKETCDLNTLPTDNILPIKQTKPANYSLHTTSTDIHHEKRYHPKGQTEHRYSLQEDKTRVGLRQHDVLQTPTHSHCDTNELEGNMSRTRLYTNACDSVTTNVQCHANSITSSRKSFTSPIDLSSHSQRVPAQVSSTVRDDVSPSRDPIRVAAEEAGNNNNCVWRPW